MPKNSTAMPLPEPSEESSPQASKHDIPTRPVVMYVTPEIAADWLKHRNVDYNRAVSPVTVRKYGRLITANKFKCSHQGVAFNRSGYLIDGQHRLLAIVATGTAVKLFVIPFVEGMDETTFDVLDNGLRRNAAQFLKHPGGTAAAAAARFLGVVDGSFGPENAIILDVFATRAEMPEVLDVVAAWPELRSWTKEVSTVRTTTFIPPGAHLAVLAQAERSVYRQRIASWVEGLAHGIGLDAHDPRLHLRNRFIRDHRALMNQTGRALAYQLITKAWNAHAAGASMGVLRASEKESRPGVIGLDLNAAPETETA